MALTDRYVTSGGAGTYAGSTSPGTPMSLSTAFTSAVAGDRINIKNDGTYTRGASDTMTNGGTITSPIIYRGYNTTIGDGSLGRTNSNGAIITTNMPPITYSSTFTLTNTGFIILESLLITGSTNTNLVSLGGDNLMKSCKVQNSNTGASTCCTTLGSNARTTVFDCDFEMTGASGGVAAVISNAVGQRILACRIKGGPTKGISVQVAGNNSAIVGNVIFASTGVGINLTSVTACPLIYGNTIVGGGADAINIITANTVVQCIINNIITDNTGAGINMVSASNGAILAYNRTRDNSSAIANGGDWTGATTYAHVTTGSGASSDYVASGSNDYRLISTSPALAVGWFPYLDLGALQRQAVSAGGGSYTFGG